MGLLSEVSFCLGRNLCDQWVSKCCSLRWDMGISVWVLAPVLSDPEQEPAWKDWQETWAGQQPAWVLESKKMKVCMWESRVGVDMMWDVGTQWRSAEIQTGRKPAVVTWCLVPEYEIGRSSPKRGARLFFLTLMQCSHSMQREGMWLCIGLELETSLWS